MLQHLQAYGGDTSETLSKEFDVPALSQDVNRYTSLYPHHTNDMLLFVCSVDPFSDHDAFEDW